MRYTNYEALFAKIVRMVVGAHQGAASLTVTAKSSGRRYLFFDDALPHRHRQTKNRMTKSRHKR